MHHAVEKTNLQRLTRIDLIRSAAEQMYTCEGTWLECALEVLQYNGIDRAIFSAAMRDAFVHCRGKQRNIILVGP